MPLTLSPCLPTDAPELARVSAAIWLPTPGNKVAWAKVPESVMIKKYEKGLHDGMTVQKQCKLPQQRHYLKVTDDATGDIAAYALWLYLPEGYCVEDEYVFSLCFYRLLGTGCAVLERISQEHTLQNKNDPWLGMNPSNEAILTP